MSFNFLSQAMLDAERGKYRAVMYDYTSRLAVIYMYMILINVGLRLYDSLGNHIESEPDHQVTKCSTVNGRVSKPRAS
jgi:hypothetical protein